MFSFLGDPALRTCVYPEAGTSKPRTAVEIDPKFRLHLGSQQKKHKICLYSSIVPILGFLEVLKQNKHEQSLFSHDSIHKFV